MTYTQNQMLYFYLYTLVMIQKYFEQRLILNRRMQLNREGEVPDALISIFTQTQKKTVTKNIGGGMISKTEYHCLQNDSNLSFISIFHRRQLTKLKKLEETMFYPKVQYANIREDQKQKVQHILAIRTKLFDKENIFMCLRKYEVQNKQQQYHKKKATLICKIVIKLIITLMTRSNYQLHTSQVISLCLDEQKNQVAVNTYQASIVGIHFIQSEEEISVEEFSQIYELLTVKLLKNKKEHRFSYQLKIRSIAKILLELILGRKISLFAEMCKNKKIFNDKKQLIPFETGLKLLEEMKSQYRVLLSNLDLIKRIEELQKIVEVNFKQFLWEVFVEQRDLTWSEVIALIVPENQIITTKPQNIKVLTFQKIMQKYQLSLQTTQGEEYINLLKDLGLYNQFKPLFIALMSLSTDFAFEAICYQDLTQLIFSPNNFDYQLKDQVYSFFNIILGDVGKYLSSLNDQKQNDKKQRSKINRSQPQVQTWQQFESVLNAVTLNFGRFQTKIKKAKFLTQNYYASGLQKYSKNFK